MKLSPSTTRSLSLYYFVLVGANAGFVFFSVLLKDHGFSTAEVARLLMVLPASMMLSGPLLSGLAERRGLQRTVLVSSAVGLAVSVLAIPLSSKAWILIPLLILAGICRGPQGPISDATTLHMLGTNKQKYGGIRAWGSLGFIVLVYLAGVLRDLWQPAPVWLLCATALTIAAASKALIPAAPHTPPHAKPSSPFALLRHPILGPATFLAVFHGMTLTTYDGLFALHIEELSLSASTTGLAMALGVIVETGVFFFGRRLLSLASPLTLISLSVLASAPRWALTGVIEAPWLLVLFQGTHGLSFGLYWLAGVALYSQFAPLGQESSAQALLPAATFGAGRLLSFGTASVVLQSWSIGDLFVAMSGVSACTALGFWALSRRRLSPQQQPRSRASHRESH